MLINVTDHVFFHKEKTADDSCLNVSFSSIVIARIHVKCFISHTRVVNELYEYLQTI